MMLSISAALLAIYLIVGLTLVLLVLADAIQPGWDRPTVPQRIISVFIAPWGYLAILADEGPKSADRFLWYLWVCVVRGEYPHE